MPGAVARDRRPTPARRVLLIASMNVAALRRAVVMDNLPVFIARAVAPAHRRPRGRWLAWFGAGVAIGLALAAGARFALQGPIAPVLVVWLFALATPSSRGAWTSIESRGP